MIQSGLKLVFVCCCLGYVGWYKQKYYKYQKLWGFQSELSFIEFGSNSIENSKFMFLDGILDWHEV